jgi:hypothetical protein
MEWKLMRPHLPRTLIHTAFADAFPQNLKKPLARLWGSSTGFAICLLINTLVGSACAEDLYVPSQFATIQAALAQARIDRLSPGFPTDETIVIHVSAGRYVETWPLILDIPNLRLEGETTLTTDTNGLPTGFIASTGTQLIAKPALTGVQTILLIGPTSSALSGMGVTVEGLVLDAGNGGSAVDGLDITVDRVSSFIIRRNVLTGSAYTAVDARASSGTIEENFIEGANCGSCIMAGNQHSPAAYSFLRNRSVSNLAAGVLVAGSSYDGVRHPSLLPVVPGTTFDRVTAVISGNDLSDNNADPNFSSGIRFLAINPSIPTAQSTGNVTATVIYNTITNNSFGVSFDAGFPFRTDARLWTASFQATFSGNIISGNKRTPALITFTRNTAAMFPNQLKDFKYLQQTTFTISDQGGDINGYWLDHPAMDPIDGRILHNTLTVNGVTLPNGRNFQ